MPFTSFPRMIQQKDKTEPHGFSIKHKKEEKKRKNYWMRDWSLVPVFFVCLFVWIFLIAVLASDLGQIGKMR